MKKRYEVIWEIFNKCSGNQMRDVHFDEVETDDPEAYVRSKFKDGYEITGYDQPDSAVQVFDITESGLLQRVSFTEI